MRCHNCGTELQDNVLFCRECGAKVVKQVLFCRECGTKLASYAKFCSNCGAKVDLRFTEEHKDAMQAGGIQEQPSHRSIPEKGATVMPSSTNRMGKQKSKTAPILLALFVFALAVVLMVAINKKRDQ